MSNTNYLTENDDDEEDERERKGEEETEREEKRREEQRGTERKCKEGGERGRKEQRKKSAGKDRQRANQFTRFNTSVRYSLIDERIADQKNNATKRENDGIYKQQEEKQENRSESHR